MAKKAPNPIDKHVGSRVRMRRMMLSMSQEKLGDALGLTFQQVQKYEKGTSAFAGLRLRFPRHLGRPFADQIVHAHQEQQAAPPHRRSRRADRR